ncbi:hypothetical protein TNCV_56261 [Trichonephila clavipes]|nr:hypothetical protein TNCV_56261 [Trichonephila clavipes]
MVKFLHVDIARGRARCWRLRNDNCEYDACVKMPACAPASRMIYSEKLKDFSIADVVSRKKKPSLQEALDLLQNLPSESIDALADDSSDEDVPANYLLEFPLNS